MPQTHEDSDARPQPLERIRWYQNLRQKVGEVLQHASGTDSGSASSIFLPKAQVSVRVSTWVLVVLLPLSSAIIWLPEGQVIAALALAPRTWWVLPFSGSLVSLAALATSAVIRRLGVGKGSGGFPTLAYLFSGPSAGVLNILTLLTPGTSPPEWVGYAMLLSMMCSAWLYYHSVNGSDEDDLMARETPAPFSTPDM